MFRLDPDEAAHSRAQEGRAVHCAPELHSESTFVNASEEFFPGTLKKSSFS